MTLIAVFLIAANLVVILRLYPNIAISFSVNDWRWTPRVMCYSWFIRRPAGMVRYINASWLCAHVQMDNEP